MDVKFIKLPNPVISPVLCKVLHLCKVNGEFPDDIKIAEVVPIYKRGDLLECIIGPYHFSQTLLKSLKK